MLFAIAYRGRGKLRTHLPGTHLPATASATPGRARSEHASRSTETVLKLPLRFITAEIKHMRNCQIVGLPLLTLDNVAP
jgi:hypothetical protein